MSELSLEVSKTVNINIEQAFDAWLDPVKLSSIMLPKPGMPNPEVTNSPVVGGEFEILMDVGEKIIPHNGVYQEIDRPNRLVFTWISPFSIDGSTVTITFEQVEQNQTKVTLNHVKFPSEESRDSHQGGWTNILGAMESFLA